MTTPTERTGSAAAQIARSQSAGPTYRNTLTAGGYLVAGALAVALFAMGFGLVLALPELLRSGAGEAFSVNIAITSIAGVFAGVAAVVIGTPLTMIAHRLLRNVDAQGVHVAVFGVVGLVSGLCCLAVLGLIGWTWFAWLAVLGAGAATATSRFIVGRRLGLGRNNSRAWRAALIDRS